MPNSERLVFHRGRQLMELNVVSESEQPLGEAGESEKDLTRIACSSNGRLLAWGRAEEWARAAERYQVETEYKPATSPDRRKLHS